MQTIRYAKLRDNHHIVLAVRAQLDTITLFTRHAAADTFVFWTELCRAFASILPVQTDVADTATPRINMVHLPEYRGQTYTWPITHQQESHTRHMQELYRVVDYLRSHARSALTLLTHSIRLHDTLQGVQQHLFLFSRRMPSPLCTVFEQASEISRKRKSPCEELEDLHDSETSQMSKQIRLLTFSDDDGQLTPEARVWFDVASEDDEVPAHSTVTQQYEMKSCLLGSSTTAPAFTLCTATMRD